MSILKSPWFWGSSLLGLLFMNSKAKADELDAPKPAPIPKPKPPIAAVPAPPAVAPPIAPPGTITTPSPGQGGTQNETFVTPVIPKTAFVKTAAVEGRTYTVAKLGAGEYLVISKSGDAYDKFGQTGDIESGGKTPEALALLKHDEQLFDQNLFSK